MSFLNSVYFIHRIDRIAPICLPFSRGLLKRRFVDSNPFLAGWGHTSEDSEDMSPILVCVDKFTCIFLRH